MGQDDGGGDVEYVFMCKVIAHAVVVTILIASLAARGGSDSFVHGACMARAWLYKSEFKFSNRCGKL